MEYISKVMSDKDGRKFIQEWLSFCGVYQSSNGEVNDMLRQEGKRQVGLYLLSLIQDTDRINLYKMMDEAYIESKENEDEYRATETKRKRDHYAGSIPDPDEYFNGSQREHRTDEGLRL